MKGKLSKKAVISIAISMAGSIIIAFSDSGNETSHLYGDLLSAVSAMAISVYILLGKSLRESMTATVYTYLVYVACSITLVILTAMQNYTISDFTPSALTAGLLLGVFSTILGHSIFSWCLKYFSPAFVSASKLCEPVVAAIMAAILFSEIPAPLQILGGIIVILGVYLYSKEERKHGL
jgi:drug/metabolite transporter (DMT)-like permease